MWKMGEGTVGESNEGKMRTTVTEQQLIKIVLRFKNKYLLNK